MNSDIDVDFERYYIDVLPRGLRAELVILFMMLIISLHER